MSEKFYASSDGAFLGIYVDGAVPPDGSIEVLTAPAAASMVWDGEIWVEPPKTQEARVAALDAAHAEDMKALNVDFVEALVIDGSNQNTRVDYLRAKRDALVAAYADNLLAILTE